MKTTRYPLRGVALRRHVVALWLQRVACFVRGYHTIEWDAAWREHFCASCWEVRSHE